MDLNMKKLQKEDAPLFRELRLHALKRHPEAFAISYEEEANKPLSFFENTLTGDTSFYGAFNQQNELIGVVSLRRSHLTKMRHKAFIGSVFVREKARGQGMGTKLLNHVIEQAQGEGVEQVQLVVAAKNKRAKQLYESLGFNRFGYEKRALKINNDYIDEEHMVKVIDNK